jgi:membrane protein
MAGRRGGQWSDVADQDARTARDDDRWGRSATRPTEVPARGWRDVLRRVKEEAKRDQVPLLAAGVAFFGLLALIPALVALISLYGLVADPDDIRRQVDDALAAAPTEVRDLIGQQLTSIDDAGKGALIAVIGGVLLALWSASSGVGHLIDAVNTAYDEDDERGFVRRKGLALLMTVGAIAFVLFAFAGIAVVPALVRAVGLGVVGTVLAEVVRWVILFGGALVALGLLYRWAPDRANARWRWVSPGAIFAAVAWLIASALFSVYVSNFGSYNETYGSLGAIVVVMLWLYLTALVVVLGAELNTELERQTTVDTTTGPSRPLGEREAYAADTVAERPAAARR